VFGEGLAAEKKKYTRKWMTLQAVMLGTFIAPLDASIVNTILPSFTRIFHTEISIVQWIPTVYLLTISCLILLYGRLGDIIGHKAVYLTGVASFTIISALCGLAQNVWMLIIFRALQGAAGAMLMAVGPAIVTSAFPPTERGKALGTFATSIAVALALGPTLGGLITEYLSWRYVFFINVPIGTFAIIYGLRAIPRSVHKPDQKLDWQGAITAFIFLLSILLYANRATDWGWFSPASTGLLISFFLFGYWFVRIEMTAPQPMLNLDLFRNRTFTLGNISLLLYFIVAFIMVFLMPFYLTLVLKLSISRVGLILATYPFVMLVVSPISGTASDYIGTRLLSCLGMAICALSMFFLSNLTEHASIRQVITGLLVFSLGMSIFQSPNSSAIMGNVPKMYLGIASGMLANMRNLGMVLGIALAGTIFYSFAPVALSKHQMEFSAAEIQQLLIGFRWAYLVGAGIAVMAVITSFFTRSTKPYK
jgi:EmrB/QacA subfamily drug resistance transporter